MDDPETERTLWFKMDTLILAVLALAFLGALIAMVAYASAEQIELTRISVIDGDTIGAQGHARTRPTCRLQCA